MVGQLGLLKEHSGLVSMQETTVWVQLCKLAVAFVPQLIRECPFSLRGRVGGNVWLSRGMWGEGREGRKGLRG